MTNSERLIFQVSVKNDGNRSRAQPTVLIGLLNLNGHFPGQKPDYNYTFAIHERTVKVLYQ